MATRKYNKKRTRTVVTSRKTGRTLTPPRKMGPIERRIMRIMRKK